MGFTHHKKLSRNNMKYKFEKSISGTIGKKKYQCTLEWKNGNFISDEPIEEGGKETGPDPYSLLLSSLASCTLITLRMYIDRKGWDIESIKVNVNMYQEISGENATTILDRDIIFTNHIPEDQKTKLIEIASHCPISKILQNNIKVRTFVFRDSEPEKEIKYSNDTITVEWIPNFCQHSTRCFTQLPDVFNPRIKKWINPNGASTEEIIKQVEKCPSGALRYYYNKQK
jgi:putative redox protein